VLAIRIPPLRERRGDITVLCETLLEQIMRTPGQRGWVLLPEAIRLLEAYDWPGNVRELRNVLERAAALAPSEVLDAGAIRRAMPQSPPRSASAPTPAGSGDLATRLAEVERDAILAALDASNGEKLAAARRLGVSRSQFYEKLRRHNIAS
jgi:DNA-binding NtrC family response regulator